MKVALEMAEPTLSTLFKKHFTEPVGSISPLKGDGSNRKLFRLRDKNRSVIGVYGPDHRENEAFLTFSRHFYKSKLPVPEIYAENLSQGIYLEEDLGDVTLFEHLSKNRSKIGPSQKTVDVYIRAAQMLPRFQINAGKTLNYAFCYPHSSFDKKSMLWDLNHFKYYFLTLAHIPFDEQALEEDFERFSEFLIGADSSYFLYRDFQSRNIMVRNGKPYFIDYQGGRRGALQYDIASLAFDAKADLSHSLREELLKVYLDTASEMTLINRSAFMKYYPGYVLIRILQALGAYGLRGFYERKTHFLQSIPYALKNLSWLLETQSLSVKLPSLVPLLKKMASSQEFVSLSSSKRLKVQIHSFPYANGIPQDTSGHGGGFVFDCRALPNPGREKRFMSMTGLDPDVISFLENRSEIDEFIFSADALVDQSVENYLARGFSSLFVAFGCTGGRHRSVFCAEKLARHLRERYSLEVDVQHAGFTSSLSSR
jgi:aminoglycoside/choline kinase family phosphotransferase